MAIIGFIVLGDKSSHGGKVIECTSHRSIDGLKVARVGDLVWCPRCNRQTKIVTNRFPQITDDGVPSAFDMDMTDCGALLYSRHNDHAGYGSRDAPASTVNGAQATAARRTEETANVQEHFALREQETGEALVGVKYTLTSADGRVIEGETDTEGRTGVMWTGTPAETQITLDSTSNADADPYHYSATISEDI